MARKKPGVNPLNTPPYGYKRPHGDCVYCGKDTELSQVTTQSYLVPVCGSCLRLDTQPVPHEPWIAHCWKPGVTRHGRSHEVTPQRTAREYMSIARISKAGFYRRVVMAKKLGLVGEPLEKFLSRLNPRSK